MLVELLILGYCLIVVGWTSPEILDLGDPLFCFELQDPAVFLGNILSK